MATWQGEIPDGYTLITSTVYDCSTAYTNKLQEALVYKIETATNSLSRTVYTKTIVWASSEWEFTLYLKNGKASSTTDDDVKYQTDDVVKEKNVPVDYLVVASSQRTYTINELKEDKTITLKGTVPFKANGFFTPVKDVDMSYNLKVEKLASVPEFSIAPKVDTVTENSIKVTSGTATCYGGTVSYKYSINDGASWQTSNTFSGLSHDTQYTITVRATNSASSSLYKDVELSATTLGFPVVESVSNSNITVNDTNTVRVTIYNPKGYSLNVSMRNGSQNGTLLCSAQTTSGTSVTFKPIKSTAYSCTPNSFSGDVCYVVYCATTNTTRTYMAKYTVPSYSIASSNLNVTTLSDVGQSKISNAYIQGKSKLKVQGNASAINGATIKSYTFTINGKSYSKSTFDCTSDIINSYGTISYSVYFTDSRNVKSSSRSGTITVYQYYTPTLSFTTIPYRCDEQGVQTDSADDNNNTRVKLFYKYNVAPINNLNTATFKIKYKRSVDSVWIDLVTFNDYSKATNYVSNAIFSADYYYDFKITVSDTFTSGIDGVDIVSISTTFTLTNYNSSGRGMAIGKVSTGNLFEVALPTVFEDKEFGSTMIKRTGSTNGVALGFQNSNGILGYVGLSGVQDGSLILYSGTDPTNVNKQRTVLDSSNWRNYIAIETVDSVTNAINSTYATYLGKSDKGANNKFMYLDDGLPVESNLSLGDETKPIYFNNGVVTACSPYCEVVEANGWIAYKYPNGELSCYRKEAYTKTVSSASEWKAWVTSAIYTIDIDLNEQFPVPFAQQPTRLASCQFNSSTTFIAFAGQNSSINTANYYGRVTMLRTSQAAGTYFITMSAHGRWK